MAGVTQQEFKLDTKEMTEAIQKCEALVNAMRDLRRTLEQEKNRLMFTWVGRGRNEFEKQYRILDQKFSDMIDDTWGMYENLMTANENYIQADVDAQKALDGVDNKF